MKTQELDALVLAALPATAKELAARLHTSKRRVFAALLRLSGQIHISAEIQDVGRPQNVWSAGAVPAKPRETFKSARPARTASRRERDRRAEAAARRKADLFRALEKIEAMGGSATARQIGDAFGRSSNWVSMLMKEARDAELVTSKRQGDLMLYALLPGWRQANTGQRAEPATMRYQLAAPPAGNAELSKEFLAQIPMVGTPWAGLPLARLGART